MRYKNNVLDKLVQTDTVINRLNLQVNRNMGQDNILETIELLKESLEKVREIIAIEPDDFEQQFQFMITVLWVVLIHVVELIIFGGYLLISKNTKYEKIIVEQQQYIDAISIVIADSSNTIKELDSKGAFEADDEVGTFFRNLKEIQNVLDQFNNRKN